VRQLYHSVSHVLADLLDVCIDGVIRQVWTMKGGMIGWLAVERLRLLPSQLHVPVESFKKDR
jgi:hypothetical protein